MIDLLDEHRAALVKIDEAVERASASAKEQLASRRAADGIVQCGREGADFIRSEDELDTLLADCVLDPDTLAAERERLLTELDALAEGEALVHVLVHGGGCQEVVGVEGFYAFSAAVDISAWVFIEDSTQNALLPVACTDDLQIFAELHVVGEAAELRSVRIEKEFLAPQ